MKRLRLVRSVERPLAKLTRAEKLAVAIAYLRRRNIYVLDQGAKKPKWGIPFEDVKAPNAELAREIANADRRRKR